MSRGPGPVREESSSPQSVQDKGGRGFGIFLFKAALFTAAFFGLGVGSGMIVDEAVNALWKPLTVQGSILALKAVSGTNYGTVMEGIHEKENSIQNICYMTKRVFSTATRALIPFGLFCAVTALSGGTAAFAAPAFGIMAAKFFGMSLAIDMIADAAFTSPKNPPKQQTQTAPAR